MLSKLFNTVMKHSTALGGSIFYGIITAYFLFNNLETFFELLIAYVIIFIISSLVKIFYFKDRPKKRKYHNLIEKIDAGSFPSGHTARITALFVILSNSQNLLTTLLFFLVTITVMYSRIHLKHHRYIDLLGGIILGFLSSYFL